MPSREKERRATIGKVKKLVTTQMINMGRVDLAEWCRDVDDRTQELLVADEPDFELAVRKLLSRLGVSHVAFYKDLPEKFPPQHTISATLRNIGALENPRWIFLDVFENGPAYTAGIRPGDLLEAVDGETLKGDLPGFGMGRKHTLRIESEKGRQTITLEVPIRKGSKTNPPIVEPMTLKALMIAPGVGYLRIGWFPGAIGLGFAKELDRAVAELKTQGSRSLIVDLRGNIGGGLGFARLASYFCPDQRPIGQSLTPARLRSGYDPAQLPRVPLPDSRLAAVRALVRFMAKDKSLFLLTQGLGEQPFHGRIAILLNEWTNSAAEMVANFSAEYGLAATVGTKTAGNILGARNFQVGSHHWVRLPVFGWLTPTGESLDGKGLVPDHIVDVDAKALRSGRDVQLEKAVESLVDATLISKK